MIVLRMVMAQEYSLSLHLSLASPTLAHRGDETCVVLVAAVVGSRITITYYNKVVEISKSTLVTYIATQDTC